MYPDITTLLKFYHSALGGVTRRYITALLDELWSMDDKTPLCGIGYSDPYLDIYHDRGIECLALNSIFSGVYARTNTPTYGAVLVKETELPLGDNTQTRILCTHILEHTSWADYFLKEIMRVLSCEGEVIFIVPNRRGLWARFENTPFGCGEPYTRKQICDLIERQGFYITQKDTTLFFPPKDNPPSRLYMNMIEYIGRRFLSRYGGIHIIKAVKRNYIPPQLKSPIGERMRLFPDMLPVTGKIITGRW